MSFDERENLVDKCEELRQKIHELTLQRNTDRLIIASMEADLEQSRESRIKLFDEAKANALKEHNEEAKAMKLQIQDLEDDIEELQAKESNLKQMCSHTLRCKKEAEVRKEEKTTPSLQSQIDSITEENFKLSEDTAMAEEEAQTLLSQIECLEITLQETRVTYAEQCANITELESKLTTLREEKQMLQLLQDSKQFAAVDPQKKGNSVFAEMDDHRRLVDERILSLQKKCEAQEETNKVLETELWRLANRIEQVMTMTQHELPPHLQKLEEEFKQVHAEQSTLIQQQLVAASKKLPTMGKTSSQNLSSMLAAKRLELQNVQQGLQQERFITAATKDQLCKALRRLKEIQSELDVERKVEKSLQKVTKEKEHVSSKAPMENKENSHSLNSCVAEIKSYCRDATECTQRTTSETIYDSSTSIQTCADSRTAKDHALQFSADSPNTLQSVQSACCNKTNKVIHVKDLPTCNQQ